MDAGAKVLGHHIHPIMIVFPLGLLSTAVVFEIIYYITGSRTFSDVTYWMMISGVIGGLGAALFGWIDWMAIPRGTRAKSVGLMHGGANATALLLFFVSWYLRNGPTTEPSALATVLAFAGVALAGVGGWLGGELVERLGIGVHPGAHPDAPSSLVKDPLNPAEH
jgi:uncharacterized membrane protein